MLGSQVTFSGSAAGAPVYPDLVSLPASNLSSQRTDAGRYLIRFDSTTANYGGPLEVTVAPGSRDIYQNVYDRNVGGTRVIHEKVGADLIYHPTHNHFHFEGFAKYELLRRDSAGVYNTTSRDGSKTSFCMLDLMRLRSTGPESRQYGGCGSQVQGISSGWGDIYDASLSGQWIDVGTQMLVDGSYAIKTTADPGNKLMESKDYNNVGITYFTVVNGRLSVASELPPLCRVEAAIGATGAGDASVGAPVELACSGFGPGENVDVYWGSLNTDVRETVKSTSSGTASAIVAIPQSDLGVHYLIALGRTSGKQAAAIVNVVPSVNLSVVRGGVESTVSVTLRGFSSGEDVRLRYYKSPTQAVNLGTAPTSGSGSGSITVDIPISPYGGHKIEAIGADSGAKATAMFFVMPSMEFEPDSGQIGAEIGVPLRGFKAGESVRITLDKSGKTLGEVTVSHSGSTTSSSARITIPTSLTPGEYEIVATGAVSKATARASLTVTALDGGEEPTVTPTTEPTSTAEPSATAVSTSTPEPIVTAEPTEISQPTQTAVASVTPESSATSESSPTNIAAESPTEISTSDPGETSTPTPHPGVSATATGPP